MVEDDWRAALERIRWPKGPVCPHCDARGEAVRGLDGKAHRAGLHLCGECRAQFTVTVGTSLKGSKLPLGAWIEAAHMLNASKPVSVREVQHALGVTYKTAWQMVKKLLESVEDYRGRLSVNGRGATFGSTVSAHVEPLLPKNRNTQAAWRRKQLRIARGSYEAPPEPLAYGVLSELLCPPATKAHAERTERFLQWIMKGGKA